MCLRVGEATEASRELPQALPSREAERAGAWAQAQEVLKDHLGPQEVTGVLGEGRAEAEPHPQAVEPQVVEPQVAMAARVAVARASRPGDRGEAPRGIPPEVHPGSPGDRPGARTH